MKGLGTDEAALIRVLAHFPAELIPHLKATFHRRHGRDLEHDVRKETSGHFEGALLAILRGPLGEDVHAAHAAVHGAGTNEKLLDDVLLARSNADLRAIKAEYARVHRRELERVVADDLSMKTQRLFAMVLAGTRMEDAAPVVPHDVERDVHELQRATEARMGADQLTVCHILSSRSPGYIRALAIAYQQRYHKPLDKVLLAEFAGHMEDALVDMLRAAEDPAMRDACRLEACMDGAGTKDNLLVHRLVQMHWNRNHMQQVRGAYRHRFGKDLVQRLRSELSGHYEQLMVAMVE